MSKKIVNLTAEELSSVDYTIKEFEKLKYTLESREFIDISKSIRLTFIRENETTDLINLEEEYLKLDEEENKLVALREKLALNTKHGFSKVLLFLCFTAFNAVLAIIFLLMFINSEATLFFRITIVFTVALIIVMIVKLCNFFFNQNQRKIVEVTNMIDSIKMKKHNVIVEINE